MSQPIYYYMDIGDTDADGLVASVTATTSAALTLDGALTSGGVFYAQDTKVGRGFPDAGPVLQANLTLGAQGQGQFPQTRNWARQIIINSAGVDTGTNYVVIGENQDGFIVSETVAGGNTGTGTESTGYFRTVSSITPDTTPVGAITVGTVDEMLSPIIVLPKHGPSDTMATRSRVVINVTGTINYTVEETHDPVLDPEFMFSLGGKSVTGAYPGIHWTTLQAAGAADTSNLTTQGATAIRITVNSYTNAAELDWKVIPATT